MKPVLSILILLGMLSAPCAPQSLAGGHQGDRRAELRRQMEALASDLLPQIAKMNGFDRYQPVRIEVKDKAELREMLIEELRAVPGSDLFRRASRTLAELGYWPRGYDLEAGMRDMLIEVMGGGYDQRRNVFYALVDLPPQMQEPTQQKIIAAHELTHALQDQREDMSPHALRGMTDADYEHLYNGVIEGMAYLSMMAISQGAPIRQASDPTPMLQGARKAMEANPHLVAFAQSPLVLKASLFGYALDGVRFCRAWLEDHPDGHLVSVLDRLPASGEQIIHYDKYIADDRPAVIDLRELTQRLPKDWRPYYENNLGEFAVRVLCETHDASRAIADTVAAGWDGCRIRAFETEQGQIVVVGLSIWDRERDAQEFQGGLSSILSGFRDPGDWETQANGRRVSFVLGIKEPAARRLALNALADVRIEPS